MEWRSGASAVFDVTAGSSSAGWIVPPSTIRLMDDPTLVRLKLMVNIGSNTAIDTRGAFGVIRWTDIDDTVPAAADQPNPATLPDLDWIYHSFFVFNTQGSQLLRELNWTEGASGTLADSKAMRKMGQDAGLLIVFGNVTGGSTVECAWGARALFKT